MEETPKLILLDKKTQMYYVGTLKLHITPHNGEGVWCAFHNFNDGYECKYMLHPTYSDAVHELMTIERWNY